MPAPGVDGTMVFRVSGYLQKLSFRKGLLLSFWKTVEPEDQEGEASGMMTAGGGHQSQGPAAAKARDRPSFPLQV